MIIKSKKTDWFKNEKKKNTWKKTIDQMMMKKKQTNILYE